MSTRVGACCSVGLHRAAPPARECAVVMCLFEQRRFGSASRSQRSVLVPWWAEPARWEPIAPADRPSSVVTSMRWRGRRARWLLPAVGLAFVSASCGVRPAATGPAQPSGSTALIFGVVQASSGCPVQRQDRLCEPRLLGDVRVEARSLPAGVIASTRTRADGHYSFRLARGRYVVVAVVRQAVPRCPHVLVSLTPPRPVRANISCASGIR